MEIEKTLFVTNGKITLGDTIFIGGKPYLVIEWDAENNPAKTYALDPKFLDMSNAGFGESYLYSGPLNITLP